jgi:hypothetical protein
MEHFEEIKQIWLSTPSTLPGAGEIVRWIKRHRLKETLKIAGLILFTLLLIALMCWVLYDYKSKLLVTRIAEACFFIALFIILVAKTTSLIRILNWKNYSNQAYLIFLKQEQTRRAAFQKTTKIIGFSIASLGLLLYIFEMLHTNFTRMVIGYLISILWIAGSWFIVRPIAIKRSNKSLTDTIKKLEILSEQLSNDQ